MASATAVASLVAQPKPNKVANDSQSLWLDLSRSRIHLSTCEAGASFRVSMFVRLFLLLLLSLLTRCAVVVVVVVVIVLRCSLECRKAQIHCCDNNEPKQMSALDSEESNSNEHRMYPVSA